jgi:hypothetical protein
METAEAAGVAKRPRGRPRKTPLVVVETENEAVEQEPEPVQEKTKPAPKVREPYPVLVSGSTKIADIDQALDCLRARELQLIQRLVKTPAFGILRAIVDIQRAKHQVEHNIMVDADNLPETSVDDVADALRSMQSLF